MAGRNEAFFAGGRPPLLIAAQNDILFSDPAIAKSFVFCQSYCRLCAIMAQISDFMSRMRNSFVAHPDQFVSQRHQERTLMRPENYSTHKKPAAKRTIVFFLVPNFTMLPFSAAVETLRIANRMLGHEAYQWRLASVDGQKVYSSSGIGLEAKTSLADERRNLTGEARPNMVLICSGIYVEEFRNKSVNAYLREVYNRGVAVGSLCTGAHVLAQAGLLNGKRCAIHWENLPGFAEAFPRPKSMPTCSKSTAISIPAPVAPPRSTWSCISYARILVKTSSTGSANST